MKSKLIEGLNVEVLSRKDAHSIQGGNLRCVKNGEGVRCQEGATGCDFSGPTPKCTYAS